MLHEDTRRTLSSSPARGVGALDRVAERLANEAGVQLSVAEAPAELIGVHRLRYREAAEQGRTTAQDDRDGLERDIFDARALQLCAWDRETLVGTLRLVLPMVGKPLPTEQAFGLTVQPAGEVVDVGRALIAPELGGEAARRAADGLLAQAWFETRARGYRVMAGIATQSHVSRYRSLGLEVELLARREDALYAVRLDPTLG